MVAEPKEVPCCLRHLVSKQAYGVTCGSGVALAQKAETVFGCRSEALGETDTLGGAYYVDADAVGANSVRAKANLGKSAQFQRKTNVLMRLGTSPAGITAMDFSVLVSMAETERAPEFDT